MGKPGTQRGGCRGKGHALNGSFTHPGRSEGGQSSGPFTGGLGPPPARAGGGRPPRRRVDRRPATQGLQGTSCLERGLRRSWAHKPLVCWQAEAHTTRASDDAANPLSAATCAHSQQRQERRERDQETRHRLQWTHRDWMDGRTEQTWPCSRPSERDRAGTFGHNHTPRKAT